MFGSTSLGGSRAEYGILADGIAMKPSGQSRAELYFLDFSSEEPTGFYVDKHDVDFYWRKRQHITRLMDLLLGP